MAACPPGFPEGPVENQPEHTDIIAGVHGFRPIFRKGEKLFAAKFKPATANERNTLRMHGAGAIELLAREMAAELQARAGGLGDGGSSCPRSFRRAYPTDQRALVYFRSTLQVVPADRLAHDSSEHASSHGL